MFDTFVQTLLSFSHSLGYFGVFFLMVVESSFIPFPSEVVIPPAAYLAAQGKFDLWLVIVSGILGSLVGALFNYYIALYLGRPLVYSLVEQKWARFLLLSPNKLEKAEKFFVKYGGASTFIGRLLPVVRQLISLPAGFAKMNLLRFIFYTTLGAGIWVSFLAYGGYYLGVVSS